MVGVGEKAKNNMDKQNQTVIFTGLFFIVDYRDCNICVKWVRFVFSRHYFRNNFLTNHNFFVCLSDHAL